MSDFLVEKGVPVPTKHSPKYPLKDLGIGDSFFVPGANISTMATIRYAAKTQSIKVVTRTVEGGFRVWRLE